MAKITVVSAAGDSRLRAVDVAFCNRSLAAIGSGFRLGSLVHVVQPIPDEALQVPSEEVLRSGGRFSR